MAKVLIGIYDYKNECPKARQMLLDKGYELIETDHAHPFTTEELLRYAPEIDAAVAGMEPWTEEVFKAAPNLKVVSRFGVGYDTVDIKKAKEHGIIATNVRSFFLSNGVAEFAVTLMSAVAKKIIPMHEEMIKGNWTRYTGNQFYGKTVGIIGLGAIGQCLARIMKGYGVRLLAYDVYHDEELARKYEVTFVTKEELLKESDFISLHIPSTPENYHFIGSGELEMMKESAVIVNTARGPVLDIEALYAALKSGKIAGAGLDVYEVEPPEKDLPIYGLSNVVMEPHASCENAESKEDVSLECANNVIEVLEGRIPKTALNV